MGCAAPSKEATQQMLEKEHLQRYKSFWEEKKGALQQLDSFAQRPFLMIKLRTAGVIEVNGKDHNGIYSTLGSWLEKTYPGVVKMTHFYEHTAVYAGNFWVKGSLPCEREEYQMMQDASWIDGEWIQDPRGDARPELEFVIKHSDNLMFRLPGMEQYMQLKKPIREFDIPLPDCQDPIMKMDSNLGKLTLQMIDFMCQEQGWEFKDTNWVAMGRGGHLREQQILFKAPPPGGSAPKADFLMVNVRCRGKWKKDGNRGHPEEAMPSIEVTGKDVDGCHKKITEFVAGNMFSAEPDPNLPSECYDLQFVGKEKFIKRTGYDGHNNVSMAMVRIADFLSKECGYDLAAANQGTYGYQGMVTMGHKGTLRWSTQLFRRPQGGTGAGGGHIRVDLRNICGPNTQAPEAVVQMPGGSVPGYGKKSATPLKVSNDGTVAFNGLSANAPEIEAELNTFLMEELKLKDGGDDVANPYNIENFTLGRNETGLEDRKWNATQGQFMFSSKDEWGANNIPQGMIKIAEFLGKKGWALRFTSGNDVRDPEAAPFALNSSPNRTARERHMTFTKANSEAEATAPLLMITLRTMPIDGGRTTEPATSKYFVDVQGPDTDGVHAKLDEFVTGTMKGTPAGNQGRQFAEKCYNVDSCLRLLSQGSKFGPADHDFSAGWGTTFDKTEFENTQWKDGRLAGESNLSKWTVRFCDLMEEQIGGWEMVACEDFAGKIMKWQQKGSKAGDVAWFSMWHREMRLTFRKKSSS